MDQQNIAVQLSHVSKRYRLGQIGGRTLQAELQSRWARLRGREDPNAPLHQTRQLEGDSFLALRDVSLTVRRGETLGIIGGNGAGKSTLLKLLSRITAPSAGAIDLYGRVSSILEVGAGFHSQMTGRENIYLNGAILGMSREEIDRKLADIIAFSEIADFIDTPVKRYSSGMLVKLAFAVAAHLDSEIMIMDEVLAVGDAAFQQKCVQRLRDAAHEEQRTVLFVSHNMNSVRELCTRCIVLEQGRIVFDGGTDAAIRFYLDRSLGADTVNMDLTQMQRPRALQTELRMERLSLDGKTEPVFYPGEPLRLRFGLRVAEPVENVSLRVTLRGDDDQAVGTAWSGPSRYAPLDREAVFTVPLDRLVKGSFYVSVGFYQGRRQLDHITRAFRIRVEPDPAVLWNVTAYGGVDLGAVEREEC